MQNGMITTQLTAQRTPHNKLYFVPTSKSLIPPSKSGKTRGLPTRWGGGGGGLKVGAILETGANGNTVSFACGAQFCAGHCGRWLVSPTSHLLFSRRLWMMLSQKTVTWRITMGTCHLH